MNRLRLFLCLLLAAALCLPLALFAAAADGGSAAGARSFAMHPDSDRLVTDADLNAFFAALSEETVESLQVVYVDPWEDEEEGPDLSHDPTPIGPAEYPALIALLREIRLQVPERPNPLTGVGIGTMYYLAVTTGEATVKLNLWDSSNLTVFGTLGSASGLDFVPAPSRGQAYTPYEKLCGRLIRLPEVARVQEELEGRSRSWFEALRSEDDRQAGLARMNGPAILPNPGNPPALAVAASDVAEYNLFQDGYWARVTAPGDQQKILNLINGIETNWNPSTGQAKKGEVLLQLRLQDGGKHEYQVDPSGTDLRADGKYYFDQQAILIFDEQLGKMLRGYPTGIAWLGTMNRRNVTEMTVDDGEGGRPRRYSTEDDPQALEAAVNRLRAITLRGGVSRKVPHGSIPEQLIGKTAERWVRLRFQNGITYQLNFYGETMLTIDSSDMSFSWFYQAERIEAAA